MVLLDNPLNWADDPNAEIPDFDLVIATCEGGGTRGISSACQMGVVQEQTGVPINDLFDMWAGTSTGAIETALVTSPKRYSPKQVLDMYMNDIPKIFNRSFFRSLYSGCGAVKAIYGNAELISCLKSYVGEFKVGDVKTPILIPVYEKRSQRSVYIDNKNGFWDEFPLHLAAAASASAPVYFPGLSAMYNGLASEFIDGGVVANNPSDIALVSAKRWFRLSPDQLVNRVLIVCFSTGFNAEGTGPSLPTGSAGGVAWAPKIYPVMSDAQGEKTHTLVDALLEANYQSFNPVFTRSLPLDTVHEKDLMYMSDTTFKYMEADSLRVGRICEALKRHYQKRHAG